ncbi:MAG: DNA polymerase [Patescibacteria group bacterium]
MPKAHAKKNTRPRIVLLDTHAIIHRAYHALPDFSSPSGEPTGALYGLSAMILKIIADLKPDYIAASFDLPKPTYRHEAFKDYKAKRPKLDDALVVQIQRSRDVLDAFGIPLYEQEGFEADDVLGTIAEELKKEEVDVIIASGDMDTLQLVDNERVRVFTLRKGIQDTILYAEDDVKERFGFGPELIPDYKGLRGDPSDNIPGIVGIGEKTATILITTFGDIESIYKKLSKDEKAFTDAGLTPRIVKLLKEGKEEAEFSKLLATIRKDVPITFILPKESWRDTANVARLDAFFASLGFRSLSARLKEYFGAPQGALFATGDAEVKEIPKETMSDTEREELRVMTWVLNSDMTDPTEDDVRAYTHTETLDDAKKKLLAELKEKDPAGVFEHIEQPLIRVVREMKERGIMLDPSYLNDLSETYHKELSGFEKRIWKASGEEFNINSPKQLGDILYTKLGLLGAKKTATGQRSTREDELVKMQDRHPIIKDILEYRGLQKLLSTYIDAFVKLLGTDGRLHARFVQAGAATGRMSSQNPNLQNIPIRTEAGRAVRGAFIAEKGYTLVAGDYSQIELRIAAILSGDKKLMKTFKEGGDIHTAVAAEIWNVAPEDVTPDMRRTTKVINFGIIYGMGANALAHTAEMTRAKAQEYLAEYHKNFPGLSAYLDALKAETRKKKYTETLFGRRRYLPAIASSLPHLRAEAERQAVNAPIQGTSADIIKRAMISITNHYATDGLSDAVRLVLQIHDELVFEVRDDVVEEAVPMVRRMMEEALPKEKTKGVPIIVDIKIGKRLNDMKPVKN